MRVKVAGPHGFTIQDLLPAVAAARLNAGTAFLIEGETAPVTREFAVAPVASRQVAALNVTPKKRTAKEWLHSLLVEEGVVNA